MIAQVTFYIDRVFDVIAIKGDGRTPDGTHERILKQSNIVVIDVDIRKNILHDHIQGFTRLQHLINALTLLSLDDAFLRLRLFAVDVLRYRFVYRDWENQFVVIAAGFNLVQHPLRLAQSATFQILWLDVTQRQRKLLILVILVVRMIIQMIFLLGCNHPPHQFHGRIVFARIATTLTLYHHFIQAFGIFL